MARNGNNGDKKKHERPRKIFGLMTKRRWFVVVVFLCSLTWSYTAGPPLSQAYISNRYFKNPHFDNRSVKKLGNIELIDKMFATTFFPESWIWQAGAHFEWPEGPTWNNDKLLFSDTKTNKIFSYAKNFGVQIENENPGDLTKKMKNTLLEPGSNGLLTDPRNSDNVFVAQHGQRRIILLNTKTGDKKLIATNYNGKKLNSPNDMAIDLNNEYLYFTDPPYGLQEKSKKKGSISVLSETYADKKSDIGFNGIYRIKLNGESDNNKVELIDKSMHRPNGIAISKINDKIRLYVTNSIAGEFNINIYEINNDKTVKFLESWNTNTIQSKLSKSNKLFSNINQKNIKKEDIDKLGTSDGITIHPTMDYLFSTCPQSNICIINENTGQLEAVIKLADGVVLSNVEFGDNYLYITSGGHLWQIQRNK